MFRALNQELNQGLSSPLHQPLTNLPGRPGNRAFLYGPSENIQKTKIMASSPISSWQIDGETAETVADFIFGAPRSLQMVIAAMKLKDAYSLEGKL